MPCYMKPGHIAWNRWGNPVFCFLLMVDRSHVKAPKNEISQNLLHVSFFGISLCNILSRYMAGN